MPLVAPTPARRRRARLAATSAAVLGSLLLWFSLATPAFGATAADDQAALQAQALTVSDLPAGWMVTNGASSGGAAQSCGGKPFGPSHRIAEAEVSFEEPAGVPQLFEHIALYSSASRAFQSGIRAIDRCHLVSLNQGGLKLKIHVAKLAYPGDKRTSAYSLRFLVRGQPVGIDVVVEELGNEIAQVSVADSPSPRLSEVRPLVFLAINKIAKSSPAPG